MLFFMTSPFPFEHDYYTKKVIKHQLNTDFVVFLESFNLNYFMVE